MSNELDAKWDFTGYVRLDEDDGDDFYCSCPCTYDERKRLKKFSRESEGYVLQKYGHFEEDRAAQKMDEMVNTDDKLSEFRERAYLAALEAAKQYVSSMGRQSDSPAGRKDMMAGPDVKDLEVEAHYYKRDIL
jgi:hypothetical protein